jgi:hypothetical protein
MQWCKGVNGRRGKTALYLIGALLGSACGSDEKQPATSDPAADTDTTDTNTGSGDPSPGNLPNLSTHSTPTPDPVPDPEPADCQVLALTSCVQDALDELSACLAASHGGTFAADSSSCVLSEGDAVVSFSQAVPRWSSAFALNFAIDVAGQTCATYAEQGGAQSSIPVAIDLVTAQHSVQLETADDLQRTLTCNGTRVSFRQSNLSQCHATSTAMPTPELTDQTLDGTYSVSPMMQANTRVFNCRFTSNN